MVAIRLSSSIHGRDRKGTLAVGAGATLGPEGPSIHLGGALGRMAAAWTRLRAEQGRTLIAAGAAAGLAAIGRAFPPLRGAMPSWTRPTPYPQARTSDGIRY